MAAIPTKQRGAAPEASKGAKPGMRASKKDERAKHEELIRVAPGQFPLERKNFIIMIAAAAAIVVGFVLMLGGSSTEEQFNPDIFSTRRVVIGPAIAFLGFVAMGVGIIYLPRHRKAESEGGERSREDVSQEKNVE